MPPSIFSTGTVVPPAGATKREKALIENMRAIDYLLDFVEKRLPPAGGGLPSVIPRRPGDKVILLKSGTGSGKSTAVPAELHKAFFGRGAGEIIVTQPRVLNAIDIVKQITQFYPHLQFGKNIGYQTGPLTRKPNMKGILFASIGILTNKLSTMDPDDFVAAFQIIIIDEVHDRSKDLDSVLFILKKFLAKYYGNPMCPLVILASATFDEKLFADYFGCPKSNYIEIKGMSFPIEEHFPEWDVNNYIDYAVDRVKKIHFENVAEIEEGVVVRDIIVFVKSGADIKLMEEAINNLNKELLNFPKAKADFEALPPEKERLAVGGGSYLLAPVALSSETYGMVEREFRDLYARIENTDVVVGKDTYTASRKVIISTPVAETGVTLETLKYCIDTGYAIMPEFNPVVGADLVKHANVTQGMAMQRRGRVGRKAPGVWYPAYTRETFDMMRKDDFSKMLKEDISETLLVLIIQETGTIFDSSSQEKIRAGEAIQRHIYSDKSYYSLTQKKPLNLAAMDFLEPPSAHGLLYAMEKLQMCGFITSEYQVTFEGFFAARFQKLSIECRRMIMEGFEHEANILDLVTIAAFVMVGRRNVLGRKYVMRNPSGLPPKQADFARNMWACEFIDYVFIWEEFNDHIGKMGKKTGVADLKRWASDNDIKYGGLLAVAALRTNIMENMIQMGLNPFYNGLGLDRGTYSLVEMIKTGADEILKLKRSIIGGFRMHLYKWDAKAGRYVGMLRRIPIKVKSPLLEDHPMYIVISDLSLVENEGVYTFSGETVSVMDGFVDALMI